MEWTSCFLEITETSWVKHKIQDTVTLLKLKITQNDVTRAFSRFSKLFHWSLTVRLGCQLKKQTSFLHQRRPKKMNAMNSLNDARSYKLYYKCLFVTTESSGYQHTLFIATKNKGNRKNAF